MATNFRMEIERQTHYLPLAAGLFTVSSHGSASVFEITNQLDLIGRSSHQSSRAKVCRSKSIRSHCRPHLLATMPARV